MDMEDSQMAFFSYVTFVGFVFTLLLGLRQCPPLADCLWLLSATSPWPSRGSSHVKFSLLGPFPLWAPLMGRILLKLFQVNYLLGTLGPQDSSCIFVLLTRAVQLIFHASHLTHHPRTASQPASRFGLPQVEIRTSVPTDFQTPWYISQTSEKG